MDWNFSKDPILGHMDKRRRAMLFEWMQRHTTETTRIVLIGGKVPKSARSDREPVTLLFIEYAGRGVVYTLTSKPAGDYPEILSVGQTDFVELDELLHGAHAVKGGNPHAHRQRKESTGRPKKYGAEDAEKVQGLKKEGHSIRKISAILGMSTFTVQKLLKCAEK